MLSLVVFVPYRLVDVFEDKVMLPMIKIDRVAHPKSPFYYSTFVAESGFKSDFYAFKSVHKKCAKFTVKDI